MQPASGPPARASPRNSDAPASAGPRQAGASSVSMVRAGRSSGAGFLPSAPPRFAAGLSQVPVPSAGNSRSAGSGDASSTGASGCGARLSCSAAIIARRLASISSRIFASWSVSIAAGRGLCAWAGSPSATIGGGWLFARVFGRIGRNQIVIEWLRTWGTHDATPVKATTVPAACMPSRFLTSCACCARAAAASPPWCFRFSRRELPAARAIAGIRRTAHRGSAACAARRAWNRRAPDSSGIRG